jgi:hypothetical protein
MGALQRVTRVHHTDDLPPESRARGSPAVDESADHLPFTLNVTQQFHAILYRCQPASGGRKIRHVLRRLRDEGRIQLRGRGRGARWEVVDRPPP